VIEKATCPVIAVPEGVLYQKIKKITYATSYFSSDINGIKKVVEIAEPFKAQLNVLHITIDGEGSPGSDKKAMESFKDLVTKNVAYNNISFQIISGQSVENTLEKYVDKESTDMLVMSTHYRDFFDKIFGRSVTKQLAYHIKIPLMTLHHIEK
jgi:nucleotide-binding universal stress UspA family protein